MRLYARVVIGTVVLLGSGAWPCLARPDHAEHGEAHASSTSPNGESEKSRKDRTEKDEPNGGEPEGLAGEVENASVTEHLLTLGEGRPGYRATAANMPLKDEEGETKATVFFVAYERLSRQGDASEADMEGAQASDEDEAEDKAETLAAQDPSSRPLTFVFNGGPGAAAVWLHLGTAGPKVIQLDPEGQVPAPPYRLQDNPASWLESTDLVFIDPVGTGYSRPAKDQKGSEFYGVREDLRWVGEFIRLYLTHAQRWASPLFLAGESYGTTRAAGLSEYLLDRHGIALNGLILISCALDFQQLQPGNSNDLPFILFLPTYTATAWYHGKLDAALQRNLRATLDEVQTWALTEYATALMQGRLIEEDRKREVAARLSRYTGLPERMTLRSDLRIDPWVFRKRLLDDEEKVIGRFDARVLGFDPEPEGSAWPGHDPSLSRYLAVYSSTFNHYVRSALGYESRLPYEVLSDKVRPWDYGKQGMGYLSMTDELTDAMIKNPHLRVLFASGYHDLATPYFATEYTIAHLDISDSMRERLRHARYEGGHMMYHRRASLIDLGEDVAMFIKEASGGS